MSDDAIAAAVRAAKRKAIFAPGPTSHDVACGRAEVERLLPHRDPFLFVDSVRQVDLEQEALLARRTVRADDPVFAGHFPGHPIYPGVLLLETMGQAGICLVHFLRRRTLEVGSDVRPADVRALKIHTALFLDAVGPGAELDVMARLVSDEGMTAVCLGQLWRGPVIAAVAVMEVYFVEAP